MAPDYVRAAAQRAIRDNGCGATISGRRAFCDDPGLDKQSRRETDECLCKEEGALAADAAFAALNNKERPWVKLWRVAHGLPPAPAKKRGS